MIPKWMLVLCLAFLVLSVLIVAAATVIVTLFPQLLGSCAWLGCWGHS